MCIRDRVVRDRRLTRILAANSERRGGERLTYVVSERLAGVRVHCRDGGDEEARERYRIGPFGAPTDQARLTSEFALDAEPRQRHAAARRDGDGLGPDHPVVRAGAEWTAENRGGLAHDRGGGRGLEGNLAEEFVEPDACGTFAHYVGEAFAVVPFGVGCEDPGQATVPHHLGAMSGSHHSSCLLYTSPSPRD